MIGKALALLLVLLVLPSPVPGGIRGPGKYYGVVVFDQWGTCYLFGGVYLMYISEKAKENLRRYEGQSIILDAKKVFQPINPGDGLITDFKVVSHGEGAPPARGDGLVITVKSEFEGGDKPRFAIEVRNAGARRVEVEPSAIGPTLFGERVEGEFSSPSDGKSTARVTRCSLAEGRVCGESHRREGEELREYLLRVEAAGGHSSFDPFTLGGGEAKEFRVTLSVPAGKYDFMSGYSPGVHEGRGIASNIISFTVGENGRAAETANRRSGDTR